MSVELTTVYMPFVDEMFKAESKIQILTNQNFSFDGAHSVKIWKIATAEMNDYGRTGATSGNWSRYGEVLDLDAETETLTLSKDRSFTFTVDRLDEDETGISTAQALARQIREKVIPEIDLYTVTKIANGAGVKPNAVQLTASSIYNEIIKATNALDNAEVPDENRHLLVTPDIMMLIKQNGELLQSASITDEMRKRGVIGTIDGMNVIKVPASRVPAKFGFLVCHPVSTVGVQKLMSYITHSNPVGISGTLVEGRIVYDAFVLDNRKNGIYYQQVI